MMYRAARIAIRVALAVAILGFAPGILEPFQPFKAVFLRAIGMGLLVWVGAEAWAGRVPRPGLLTLSVMGWVGAVGLATLFSLSPHLSFLGEVDQREGFLTVLALAGLHVAAGQAHRDERHVRETLRVVAFVGVAAAAYAQLQLAGWDPVHWEGVHTFAASGAVVLRPAGPLGNPILLGTVLASVLPLVLARLAEVRSDPAWLIPAAALVAASLVMTLSRGAWLAAATGVSVAVTLALWAGAAPRRVAWTLAASLSPALLFGVGRAYAPLVARLGEGLDGHSMSSRGSIARGALQLWSERPFFGVGPDAFGLAYPRVQEPALWREDWIGLPVHAHSVPLQILATLGVLGVLAGLAWLVAAVFAFVRAWGELPSARAVIAALAGAFAALLVAGGFNVVGLAGAALFAVCTALPDALYARPELAVRPVRALHPAVPALAAGLMCLVELTSGLRELQAFALARVARDEPGQAAVTPSEWRALTTANATSLQRAVARWPNDDLLWRLTCQTSLARAAASASEPRGAAADAESVAEHAALRAVALEPERAACFGALGDALAARALRSGSVVVADSAEAAYVRAAGLAPADGWWLVAHARFQLARRSGARAFEISQQIVGLYPGAAVGHTLSGAALMLLRRPGEARVELLRARDARWEEDAGAQRAAVERLLETVGVPRATARDAGRRPPRSPAPRP